MINKYRLIPKAADGFKTAFDAARAKGDRYFFYNGKTFNTMKKGEDSATWAKNFKDNLTSGGASNVQTSINRGWTGKGASHGRYNSKGEYVKFEKASDAGPLAVKGDNINNNGNKGWGYADTPDEAVNLGTGDNRRTHTANGVSGVEIGGMSKSGTELPEVVVTTQRPKKTKITGRNLAGAYGAPSAGGQSLANQRQLEASSNAFDTMRNASANPFSLEGSRYKTYVDPSGKTYRYVTRNGINYLDNGRWWNPKTKRGGNWKYSGNWLTGGTFTHFKNGGSLNGVPFYQAGNSIMPQDNTRVQKPIAFETSMQQRNIVDFVDDVNDLKNTSYWPEIVSQHKKRQGPYYEALVRRSQNNIAEKNNRLKEKGIIKTTANGYVEKYGPFGLFKRQVIRMGTR